MLGFKPCASCSKTMPLSNLHSSCLKCLGEAHTRDSCQICSNVKPRTKKDWEARLKFLLLEVALRPSCELCQSDLASSISVLVRSTPPTMQESQHHLPYPVPREKHRKLSAEKGHSPTPKKARHGKQSRL